MMREATNREVGDFSFVDRARKEIGQTK